MGKKLIIIDDMLFMRAKLRQLAEASGYEVVGEAENGLKGLELYKEKKPDLVFLDITMPEMDGLTALRLMREFDKAAKVVIISAMGQEERVKEAIREGAVNFIVKPFQNEKITKLLSSL